jgi:SAM-dependent methyltransferase
MAVDTAGDYVGSELDLFAKATRWKQYFRSTFHQYLKGDVLEVGAGLGGTTEILCDGTQKSWVCLEPDKIMTEEIARKIRANELPACCRAQAGFLDDLAPDELFDTIMYIDVLEHIEDDKNEALNATHRLNSGGTLIILSPAHQSLYSPFDKAIGHYRRYSLEELEAVVPSNLQKVSLRYIDSIGYFASLANRMLLRQSMPTERQIFVWDKAMIPISEIADPLLGFRFGKTVIGIWKKT